MTSKRRWGPTSGRRSPASTPCSRCTNARGSASSKRTTSAKSFAFSPRSWRRPGVVPHRNRRPSHRSPFRSSIARLAIARYYGFMARGLPLTLVVVAATAVTLWAQDLTRAEADHMAEKLAAIEARGNTPAHVGTAPLRTSFTDREVNAYFRYNGKERLPD